MLTAVAEMTHFFNQGPVSNQAVVQYFHAHVSLSALLAILFGKMLLTYCLQSAAEIRLIRNLPVATLTACFDLSRTMWPVPPAPAYERTATRFGIETSTTRILVVHGLGGSGKSQLVLDYVREDQEDHSTTFWVEAGQKESIERDYLQIHRLLFDPISVTKPETISIEDAVVTLKRWFHGQAERSLLVLDSADAIDDNDNE